MSRPQTGDYNHFYQTYVNHATGNTVQELLAKHSVAINDFINSLPEEKAAYKYADNKWTVKDVLQHMIDAERIFVYRALTFARKDETPLPGFEENDYAAHANTSLRSLQSLKEEFIITRKSTDIFLGNLTQEELAQTGSANNNSITVNAIAFIIIGHILHHKGVLEERYL